MAKPNDLATREPAAQTLLARAQRLRNRAARAPIGSNERKKCLAQAMTLAACAQEIATDDKFETDWWRGWRTLTAETIQYVRNRDRKVA